MTWKRKLIRLVALGVAAYLLIVIALVGFESKLVYPAPQYPSGDWNAEQYGAIDIRLQSSDSVTIHGWYYRLEQADGALLFCHGNAEHVAHNGEFGNHLAVATNCNVFVFDYRGYGRSTGAPNEAGVLADAETAVQWLAEENGIEPAQVIVFGRSLGGGVACHLVDKYGTRGLILQSTFSSMVDTAGSHYPCFPVKLVMRNRYNSVLRLKDYHGPLLQIHGSVDRVIPIAIGRRLFDSVESGKKSFVVLDGLGHNNVPADLAVAQIVPFVRALNAQPTRSPLP